MSVSFLALNLLVDGEKTGVEEGAEAAISPGRVGSVESTNELASPTVFITSTDAELVLNAAMSIEWFEDEDVSVLLDCSAGNDEVSKSFFTIVQEQTPVVLSHTHETLKPVMSEGNE